MPIIVEDDYDMFLLQTKSTSYAFGIAEEHMLMNFYWGSSLESIDELPLIIPFGGASFTNPKGTMPIEFNSSWGMSYVENCLKLEYADGVRSFHFKYDGWEIVDDQMGKECLKIKILDEKYNFHVSLFYQVHEEEDIISRWMVLENKDPRKVRIEHVYSALWNFPIYRDFTYLTHLYGSHSHEFQVAKTQLNPGKMILESRRGTTGHYFNPFFMLDDGNASEDSGQVYFGGIAWSGSWKMAVERTSHGFTRISGGLNDYDFEYVLEENQKFITPKFHAGFSNGGFGLASRNFHHFQEKHLLPKKENSQVRKVVYNSWEVTGFRVNEKEQMELAEVAARLGVEIFVMDDGWFGQRNNDKAGLGDWEPNPDKFPNGLGPLIKKVNDLGMEFGLWFEPEMANPDSETYRKHPDWIIQFPGRTPDQGRNQLNLNLALPEVKEFVFSAVDIILSRHPGITYIKWDMNKSICDIPERWMWYDYVKNLYDIFGRLRNKFPYLHVENCSGGGGRMDMGLMPYYDTNWTSDNTNPFQRLFIQEGFSLAYTPRVMSAWVTDSGKFDLEYRFHSSMMGIMAIGANILTWSEEEVKIAQKMVEKYKQIREIVQLGDVYRIKSPREGNTTIVEYVSRDKSSAIIFVFKNVSDLKGDVIKVPVRGLDENRTYSAPGLMGKVSGKTIMNQGITTSLTGTHKSTILEIK